MNDLRLAIEERLPALLQTRHPGAAKAATGKVLLKELRAGGLELTKTAARRLQEAVETLRFRGAPIGSTSRAPAGYFWMVTEEEREEFCRSALRRIGAIARTMRSQRKKKPMPVQFGLFQELA